MMSLLCVLLLLATQQQTAARMEQLFDNDLDPTDLNFGIDPKVFLKKTTTTALYKETEYQIGFKNGVMSLLTDAGAVIIGIRSSDFAEEQPIILTSDSDFLKSVKRFKIWRKSGRVESISPEYDSSSDRAIKIWTSTQNQETEEIYFFPRRIHGKLAYDVMRLSFCMYNDGMTDKCGQAPGNADGIIKFTLYHLVSPVEKIMFQRVYPKVITQKIRAYLRY